MNDNQMPVINGVPLNELPQYCQKLFDKVVELKQAEQELSTKHAQKKLALEELANMLAKEVEEYKSSMKVEDATVVESEDLT